MEGRKSIVCLCALLFAGAGCVPGSSKNTSVEASPPPEVEDTSNSTPLFGSRKREPRIELALAVWREKKAAASRDKPDEQFRELDEARKIYHEILNYDPGNLEALRGLGRAYVAMRDFDRATAIYKKAIEKHPREPVVYAEYSIAFSKRNRFDDAIAQLKHALDIDPENQDHQRMLAVNLVCAGQVDRGVEVLTRARGAAAAHYYVARLLWRQNQNELAREHTRKALEANPNLADAQALLTELEQPTAGSDIRRATLDFQLIDEK
jgi:tetratricopeptide (TPR) repeat protein